MAAKRDVKKPVRRTLRTKKTAADKRRGGYAKLTLLLGKIFDHCTDAIGLATALEETKHRQTLIECRMDVMSMILRYRSKV